MLLRQLSYVGTIIIRVLGGTLAETSEQNIIQQLTQRKDVYILRCLNDENA